MFICVTGFYFVQSSHLHIPQFIVVLKITYLPNLCVYWCIIIKAVTILLRKQKNISLGFGSETCYIKKSKDLLQTNQIEMQKQSPWGFCVVKKVFFLKNFIVFNTLCRSLLYDKITSNLFKKETPATYVSQ